MNTLPQIPKIVFLLLVSWAVSSNSYAQPTAAISQIKGRCSADSYPGVDGGAKVSAALADSSCLIVDATRLTADQKAASTIVIGTKQQLLLGPSQWTFNGSPNIDLQGRGASLLGTSYGQTRLINNTPSGSSIRVGNLFQEIGQIDLEVAANVTRTGGGGLDFAEGSSLASVHDLLVNVGYYGIWLRNKGNGKFNNITFGLAAVNPRNILAWIQGGPFGTCCIASSQFSNIIGNGGSIPPTVAGIVLDTGLDTWEFQNVDFGHIGGTNFTSLLMKDSLNIGLPPEWIRFSNASFEGSGTGSAIIISGARSVAFSNVSAAVQDADHSIIIDGPQVYGVTLNSGFALYGNKEVIYIPGTGGSPSGINISNLQIGDGSLGSPGKYCDMYVGQGVGNLKVSGNSFQQITKRKTSQLCSLQIAKGVGGHVKIIGNDFAQGGPEAFVNGATSADMVVSGNSGVGSWSDAVTRPATRK